MSTSTHKLKYHSDLMDENVQEEHFRILLIEDDMSDVFLIKRMLYEFSDYGKLDFLEALRMAEALEMLDKYPVDLIILDLNLLDIEGSATVAALHSEFPDIPIVIHSGSDDKRLKEEAIICGAKHYLVKGRQSPYSFHFMVQDTLRHART